MELQKQLHEINNAIADTYERMRQLKRELKVLTQGREAVKRGKNILASDDRESLRVKYYMTRFKNKQRCL